MAKISTWNNFNKTKNERMRGRILSNKNIKSKSAECFKNKKLFLSLNQNSSESDLLACKEWSQSYFLIFPHNYMSEQGYLQPFLKSMSASSQLLHQLLHQLTPDQGVGVGGGWVKEERLLHCWVSGHRQCSGHWCHFGYRSHSGSWRTLARKSGWLGVTWFHNRSVTFSPNTASFSQLFCQSSIKSEFAWIHE